MQYKTKTNNFQRLRSLVRNLKDDRKTPKYVVKTYSHARLPSVIKVTYCCRCNLIADERRRRTVSNYVTTGVTFRRLNVSMPFSSLQTYDMLRNSVTRTVHSSRGSLYRTTLLHSAVYPQQFCSLDSLSISIADYAKTLDDMINTSHSFICRYSQ